LIAAFDVLIETFTRAAAEFEASQRLHADRAENRVTLGIFLSSIGRVADAETEYRAAIRLAPAFAPAYVNLADLLRAQDDEAQAERILRDGLGAAPNDATLHHALGLLYARAKKSNDAVTELGRAVSLEAGNARFVYVYAVALEGVHRMPEAIRVLAQGRVAHPRDRDLLFALASAYRDTGDRVSALRYARLLVESFPQDREAALLLQSLARPSSP